MGLDLRKQAIMEKIKEIYLPFFIIAVVFIACYTCFNWYLIARNISVREDILELLLPFTLPWLPLVIWIRPRIKLLDLKRKKGDLPTLYLIVAGFTIIAPCVIAQDYLSTATGKLTKLHYIDEICQKKPTKFYTVSDCFIDRHSRGVNYTSNVSGRYNSRLDLDIYIACAIYSSNEMEEPTKIGSLAVTLKDRNSGTGTVSSNTDADTAKKAGNSLDTSDHKEQGVVKLETANDPPEIIDFPAPKAWLCMRYNKQISNRLSDEEKKEEYHKFYRTSLEDFNENNLRSFSYLSRVGNNKRRDGYADAIKKVVFMHAVAEPAILEGIYEPYEYRNGEKLLWVFLTFLIGSVIWIAMLLYAPFEGDRHDRHRGGTTGEKSN
jgi:rhomboid protease GluP